jgi:hypothetical protein
LINTRFTRADAHISRDRAQTSIPEPNLSHESPPAKQRSTRGYSYREICQLTDWTYTKVNRCLTEGRRALARRLAAIESSGECATLDPLLVGLADGETSAYEFAVLRRHLSTCLDCRAYLRSLRAARHARGRDRPPRHE